MILAFLKNHLLKKLSMLILKIRDMKGTVYTYVNTTAIISYLYLSAINVVVTRLAL